MKKTLVALALACGIGAAHANVITTPVSVGAASVSYFSFDYANLPGFSTLTVTTSGSTEDPELFLFFGSVGVSGFVGSDDDSGPGLEASLTLFGPSSGRYIAAVGQWDLTLSEAISGYNPTAATNPAFTTTLAVSGYNGTVAAAVPTPATLALLGAGLLGLGLARRRS